MRTYYIHIYACVLRIGIDLEVTNTITLDELRDISTKYMEKESYGLFLAHPNNQLIRCSDHTFITGLLTLQDIDLRNGECFYII